MAAPNEYFNLIPGTKDYYASNLGNIRRNGKNLSLCKNDRGYAVVNINSKTKTVHRLIAITFISNSENKRTVNHIDGDRLNNNIKNLEWNTHSENLKHKYSVLKCKPQRNYGSKNGFSKLLLNEVTGVFYDSIIEASEIVGLKRSTLSAMLTGQNKNKTNLKYV